MGRYLVKTILDFDHLQERVSTVSYVMTPAARFELCEGGAEYPLVVRGQVGPGGLPEARGGPDESRTKPAPAAEPADGRRSRVLRTASWPSARGTLLEAICSSARGARYYRGVANSIMHPRVAGGISYRAFHTGFRFSTNARGPSAWSSLCSTTS